METIEIKNPKYIIFVETGENKVAELLLTDEQKEIIFLLITGACDYNMKTGSELHIERRKVSHVNAD